MSNIPEPYITPEVEQWLRDAGYEYHCFISWPRTKNSDITECARRLKDKIEESLAASIPEPKVFLDESSIRGGEDWEKKITCALCKSVVLVAVCAPIYFHPTHEWCALEWAGMEMLGRIRLPNEINCTIIPIMLRNINPLPESVAKIQYHDFSKISVLGKGYYKTKEYRNIIEKIREHIEEVCKKLVPVNFPVINKACYITAKNIHPYFSLN